MLLRVRGQTGGSERAAAQLCRHVHVPVRLKILDWQVQIVPQILAIRQILNRRLAPAAMVGPVGYAAGGEHFHHL